MTGPATARRLESGKRGRFGSPPPTAWPWFSGLWLDQRVRFWGRRNPVDGTVDVRPLLAAAERGDDDDAASLYDRLCHQGTTTATSYTALPELFSSALRCKPAPYIAPLFLAADILAATDRPAGIDVTRLRRTYAADILKLEALTVRCLNLPALHGDLSSFIYLMQVLLALQDEPTWSHHLTGLAGGEYELLCPTCGRDLYAVIDPDIAVITEGYTPAEQQQRTSIDPADPPRAGDAAAERLHRLALDHDQPQVAAMIAALFGLGTCPECRARFSVADTVTADPQPVCTPTFSRTT